MIFGVFVMRKPRKSRKFWKIGLFLKENPKNGYPFWPKSPLKMGMGFEARAAHPCPTQIWVPPPGVSPCTSHHIRTNPHPLFAILKELALKLYLILRIVAVCNAIRLHGACFLQKVVCKAGLTCLKVMMQKPFFASYYNFLSLKARAK